MQLEDYLDVQSPVQIRVKGLEDKMLAEQERDPSPAVQRLYQIIREHREQEYRLGS